MIKKNEIITILVISIVALLGLIWLIYFNQNSTDVQASGTLISNLSGFNALMNFLSAVCLVKGFVQIKAKNKEAHKKMMLTAFLFSTLFLMGYLVYHFFHGETKFIAQGLIRPTYFTLLISHIVLSAFCLPMVLLTFYAALKQKWSFHKKMAKWTFPIWLYVSVTGVLVYFFLKFLNY